MTDMLKLIELKRSRGDSAASPGVKLNSGKKANSTQQKSDTSLGKLGLPRPKYQGGVACILYNTGMPNSPAILAVPIRLHHLPGEAAPAARGAGPFHGAAAVARESGLCRPDPAFLDRVVASDPAL